MHALQKNRDLIFEKRQQNLNVMNKWEEFR